MPAHPSPSVGAPDSRPRPGRLAVDLRGLGVQASTIAAVLSPDRDRTVQVYVAVDTDGEATPLVDAVVEFRRVVEVLRVAERVVFALGGFEDEPFDLRADAPVLVRFES